MKVTWIPDNEYSGLYESAEWQQVSCGTTEGRGALSAAVVPTGHSSRDENSQIGSSVGRTKQHHSEYQASPAGIQISEDRLAGPRSLVAAGIVLIVFWGVVFWLLGAYGKVARYF